MKEDPYWEIPNILHPAFEDGTDRVFRNVGKSQSDAGEIPKRIHTIFKTRRKFEIKFTIIRFSYVTWVAQEPVSYQLHKLNVIICNYNL
jgi:hypothetical protein